MPHGKGHFWSVWLIEKHVKRRIWVLGKGLAVQKNGWTDLNDMYVFWPISRKKLPFGGCDDCTCVKIFTDVIF